MISAILGSIISYLAGSLLWRIALILGAVFVIVWLARRLRKGKTGQPAEGQEFGALILLIAIAGAVAGAGYGAMDRAAESAQYTKDRARFESENAVLAAELATARRNAEHARVLADKAVMRAAASDKRVIAAQRKRAVASKSLSRRVSHASKNSDGTVPTVGTEWVRIYNSALGFDGVPATAPNSGQPSGPAAAANPAGAGAQPNAPGLLADPVTTADVLTTHIDNADAARDSAERLSELQNWYNDLREERNKPPIKKPDDDDEEEEESP